MDPFDSLRGHYGLQTASEVRSDLRFEISDLNYLHIHVHIAYMVWTLLTASEATMASKQPQRSDLTSDLKSVTSITYISMCILLICFGPILRPLWWPQRPLQPPNGLRAQILPQIWKLWPKLHMLPCLFGLFRPFLDKSQKIKKMNRPLLDLSASPQVIKTLKC